MSMLGLLIARMVALFLLGVTASSPVPALEIDMVPDQNPDDLEGHGRYY